MERPTQSSNLGVIYTIQASFFVLPLDKTFKTANIQKPIAHNINYRLL